LDFNDRATSAFWTNPSGKDGLVCFHENMSCEGKQKCWDSKGASGFPIDFVKDGINDIVTSVSYSMVSTAVIFFEHGSYQGRAAPVATNGQCWNTSPEWTNQISSSAISPGYCLSIYKGTDCLYMVGNVALYNSAWNDQVKSYKTYQC
jgi:hypothetical protein